LIYYNVLTILTILTIEREEKKKKIRQRERERERVREREREIVNALLFRIILLKLEILHIKCSSYPDCN